ATDAWRGERWMVRLALADVLDLPAPPDPDTALPATAEVEVPGVHAVVDGLTIAGFLVPGEVDAAVQRDVLARALEGVAARAGA
ncbi:TetR family transcriptional regulator C-terminal domain-containing protein, partial [Kytococcus sp. HMSC28H12]